MNTRRKRCIKGATGEKVPNVLKEHEVVWVAETSHRTDWANDEVESGMKPSPFIKTEEDVSYTDGKAHVLQEFIPVPQTDDFIKPELDEEFICDMNDSAANLDSNAGSSSQANNQQILSPGHGRRARASISYKECAPSEFASHTEFRCEFCPRTFSKKSSLKTHLKHNHEFPCDLCEKTFSNKNNLTSHKRYHTKKVCEVCGSSFSPRTLIIHMVRKHLDKAQTSTPDSQTADDNSIDSHTEEFLDEKTTSYGQASPEIAALPSESKSDINSEACKVCLRIYPTKYIRLHMRLKHSEPKYKCEFCSRLFKTKQHLDSHLLTHATDRKPDYVCDLCGKPFYYKNAMVKHKKKCILKAHPKFIGKVEAPKGQRLTNHLKEKATLECDICSRSFKTKSILKAHLSTHFEDRTRDFACDLCEKKFYTKRLLWIHKKVHASAYQCKVCEHRFSQVESLKVHMLRRLHYDETQEFTPQPSNDATVPMKTELMSDEEIMDEGNGKEPVQAAGSRQPALATDDDYRVRGGKANGSVACEVCRNSYPADLIETHMRITHGEGAYKCPFCSKVCLRKADLERHLKSHDDNRSRPYACEQCEYKFTAKRSLLRHMTTQHTKHRMPEFNCELCVKKFYTQLAYERHKRTHTKDGSVTCEVCRNSYPAELIKTHMRITHGEGAYKCSFCPRVYSQKSALEKHIGNHDNRTRPYACEQCESRFLSEIYLKRHMATQHTKNRIPKFNCEFCEKKFYTKHGLKEHLGTHTGVTVSCEVCGARFKLKQSLRMHMVRKHPAEMQPSTPDLQTASSDGVHTKEELKSDEEFLNEEMH